MKKKISTYLASVECVRYWAATPQTGDRWTNVKQIDWGYWRSDKLSSLARPKYRDELCDQIARLSLRLRLKEKKLYTTLPGPSRCLYTYLRSLIKIKLN